MGYLGCWFFKSETYCVPLNELNPSLVSVTEVRRCCLLSPHCIHRMSRWSASSFCLIFLVTALHNLVTILSESILVLCLSVLSLWSTHHISMWCKRPGDGDCLVRGRSCDDRFFVCDGHGLLGFFDKSVFLCLGRLMSFRRSLYWLKIRSILHWTNQPLDFMFCLQSGGLML